MVTLGSCDPQESTCRHVTLHCQRYGGECVLPRDILTKVTLSACKHASASLRSLLCQMSWYAFKSFGPGPRGSSTPSSIKTATRSRLPDLVSNCDRYQWELHVQSASVWYVCSGRQIYEWFISSLKIPVPSRAGIYGLS